MRTRTETEVRKWLKDHTEESVKILRDIEVSNHGFRTCPDVDHSNDTKMESMLSYLLQSVIIQGHDLPIKLDSFCSQVSQLFNVDKCAVFVLNRDNSELEIICDLRWESQIPVKISQGIVGRSASLNETILVNNPSHGSYLAIIE